MPYIFLFIGVLVFTATSNIIMSFYNIKIYERSALFKEEGNSYILSELNNIADKCPEEGDTLDNYNYSINWNYDKQIDITLSCDNNGSVINFQYKGCRDLNFNTDQTICYEYEGTI
jgi:hypothetical protein